MTKEIDDSFSILQRLYNIFKSQSHGIPKEVRAPIALEMRKETMRLSRCLRDYIGIKPAGRKPKIEEPEK